MTNAGGPCCNGVFLPGMPGGLPKHEVTIATALRDAGYRTMAVGKWHLGGVDAYHPMDYGFDGYYGCPHGLGASLPDNSVTPVRPRICSTALMDCIVPPLDRRRGDDASNPSASSRCGSLLLSIAADVRSADDVIAFEGMPGSGMLLRRSQQHHHAVRYWG